MTVIHRCQNMTSRANLCSRYGQGEKDGTSRPQVISRKTIDIQWGSLFTHAAANFNNRRGRETHLKMQMDEKIKLGCIVTSKQIWELYVFGSLSFSPENGFCVFNTFWVRTGEKYIKIMSGLKNPFFQSTNLLNNVILSKVCFWFFPQYLEAYYKHESAHILGAVVTSLEKHKQTNKQKPTKLHLWKTRHMFIHTNFLSCSLHSKKNRSPVFTCCTFM